MLCLRQITLSSIIKNLFHIGNNLIDHCSNPVTQRKSLRNNVIFLQASDTLDTTDTDDKSSPVFLNLSWLTAH